jgi:hypothetical protein
MSGRRALFVIITLLAFLAACSESSLLLRGFDEQSEVRVSLQAPQSLVRAGDEIEISIVRETTYRADDGQADSVIIELLDYDDVILATQRYNSVEDASSLPAIPVPDLEPDLYRLVARYQNGDETISTTEVPLFLVRDTFRIRGLSSFPASSYPEADSLLSLSLDIPMGSDPFLVWYVNGERAAAGYLAETGTILAVAAPEIEGVFPVRVDLYPVWHADADPAELSAPVRFSSEIFVSQDPTVLPSDLGPDAQYFMLYHMRGTTRDSGRRSELFPQTDFDGERFGAVELSARDRFFGYAFDGRSGIAFPGYIWPVFDNEFSPMSISFRILPTAVGSQQTLLESEISGDGAIAVLISEDGRLGLQLGATGDPVWSELPVVLSDVIADLTISLIPDEDELIVHFYSDGLLISTARIPFIDRPPQSLAVSSQVDASWSMLRGETRLGANTDGYVGIIDEFGVFFMNEQGQPAADESIFLESVISRYGSSLIIAEDFVNPGWQRVVAAEGDVETGDAELILAGDASLTLPQFDLSRGPVQLDLRTSGDGPLWLGVVGEEAQSAESYTIPAGSTTVRLRGVDNAVEITIGEADPQILATTESSSRISVVLRSGDTSARVVESIVMRYLADQTATEVGQSQTE